MMRPLFTVSTQRSGVSAGYLPRLPLAADGRCLAPVCYVTKYRFWPLPGHFVDHLLHRTL